jgi:parvulin-like peptidyl-prolyl isomerase
MFGRMQRVLIVVVLGVLTLPALAFQAGKKSSKSKPAAADDRDKVLVVVNGQKITQADVNRKLRMLQVPENEREAAWRPQLERMVEERLIQQFLASRKTAATKQEIDETVNHIREAARKRGSDPDKALAELGYTTESLREEFALPIAWRHHVDRAIPQARLKKYFEENRAEFDGTTVRSSQIVIKVPKGDEAARQAAEAKLASVRKQIVAGRVSFEEAARQYSEGPSKEQGGDVGWFPYSGKMPLQLTREVFRLKVGDISPPFHTTWGVHLVLATDRKPGELSLEDVRDEVLARMSQELWNEQVAELRKTAKIDWKVEPP